MKNYFVACGGTGAHVMLAMIRLHILGYPFGLFVSEKGKKFPDLFLVDQDDTDGMNIGESTAWEEVKQLLRKHPGRYMPGDLFISNRLPRHKVVTPLPVGPDGDFSEGENDHLEFRFQGSSVLELITSQHQRKIKYSLGMMASPAVGSLLFKLKEQDIADPKSGYKTLLDDLSPNPVVICGSIVGGTGASVAPTLAQGLHENDAKVMAVLVHRWFQFSEEDKSGKKSQKARKRNKEMVENAASGLALVGEDLSNKVATVLVGVPDSQLVSRKFTGDNRQAHQDSYAHVVAAVASMRHLLTGVVAKGLYGVSASEDSMLTGDIKFGESDASTLDDLFGQAEMLVQVLDLYCDILENYDSQSRKLGKVKSWVNFLNFGSPDYPKLKICEWILSGVDGKIPKIQSVVEEVRKIKGIYVDLLKWLRGLGIECQPMSQSFFHLETNHIERIRKNLQRKNDGLPSLVDEPLRFNAKNEISLKEEEYIALSLFHWTADWIRDSWGRDVFGDKDKSVPDGPKARGYWPPSIGVGLHPKWETTPGILGRVDDGKIGTCIENYFKLTDTSHNGWADPLAAVRHYKFQTERDPTALRKLELLLVGYALKVLKLEDVKPSQKKNEYLSIETLIRGLSPNLANHQLVHPKSGKIYGFNSPDTLLCPLPDIKDDDWGKLWEEINGYAVPTDDWRKSDKWVADARKARNFIDVWAGYLRSKPRGNDLLWAKLLSKAFDGEAVPFGIGDWLPVDDEESIIPLPVQGYSGPFPESHPSVKTERYEEPNDEKILTHIPDFDDFKGFKRIKASFFPGFNYEISMIWKEHLDELQNEKKIFAWGKVEDENQTWIMVKIKEGFKSEVIFINNLRVIDVNTIKISKCIPLRQRLVPGSIAKVEDGELKYPDLPILPEYVSLVEVPPGNKGEGKRLIDHNWEGIAPCSLDRRKDKVIWKVHLSGRPTPEEIEVRIGDIKAEAHWMVWPNFKAKNGQFTWCAYYIYEHSTRKELEARVMVVDNNGIPSRPEKRPSDSLGPGRALSFDARNGRHSGTGPPVAFCAYDHGLKEYVGLYIIRLNEYEKDNSKWEVAIDFGTSHTVAAQIDSKSNLGIPIDLKPELVSDGSQLSWHASENWPGDDPAKKSDMQLEVWRPTYLENQTTHMSVLPSDLWSFEDVDFLKIANIGQHWDPMTHYAIPLVQLSRSDSHKHVISGFKWGEMSLDKFKSKVPLLKEKYLRMAIEIFVADMVRSKQRLPREIQFTFTYPLRGTSDGSTAKFERAIKNALVRSKEDLGYKLTDPNNGKEWKLYSESHAAADATGKGTFGEVKLVADLGGGTLDTFISTEPKDENDIRFKKVVADSARLGGDLLLGIFAEERENYLPKGSDKGWGENKETCMENLRAWMRSEGSTNLFAVHPTGHHAEGLGLRGFDNSKDSQEARELIERYFRLITDFLARSIVAYVSKDVLPNLSAEEQKKNLELCVRLQGNGWRLWYASSSYAEIQKKMGQWIKIRADQLWGNVGDQFQSIGGEDLWHEDTSKADNSNPKLDPICEALRKSDMDAVQVIKNSYKFPLCRVTLQRTGRPDEYMNWFDEIPSKIAKDKELEIKNFDPALCFHSRENSDMEIEIVGDKPMSNINKMIKREKTADDAGVHVPIAAIIWENVFRSPEFKNRN